jgi:hypothetical protein
VELASNLIWGIVALSLLGVTYRGVRRGAIRIPMAHAMAAAVLICFILLPVLSLSDDLLEAKQGSLPLASQTWRMATEAVSAGLDILPSLDLSLLFLMCFYIVASSICDDQWNIRPLAERLARSQRLRPPPCAAL